MANQENRIALKNIQNMYKLLVKAVTSLHKAIEWQDCWWAVSVSTAIVGLINLFLQTIPSLVCEQIHYEVDKIKEITSSHLCSTLDKESRKYSRALLADVREHDLSLKLLRALDFGISLPIKCLTLTFTYLIILLQFGKLIEKHLINEKV
ncbi:hypothetical protein EVAR_11701_1 [Eumeta japonica]|uniref:Uncharacterized protein n=1 Tax=Eumeta variegata TaxID=151549 RepID=A0A4C1U639_EUMVA|nr:hypothetical protein EVAR_11701_1 [Eumeta japonica]